MAAEATKPAMKAASRAAARAGSLKLNTVLEAVKDCCANVITLCAMIVKDVILVDIELDSGVGVVHSRSRESARIRNFVG